MTYIVGRITHLETFANGAKKLQAFNVEKVLYENHCPLGNMCPEHLALHKKRGGAHCAAGKCDVCKWNEKK